MLNGSARWGIGKNGHVFDRRDAAEFAEFVYEVGLIVIAVIEREIGPVGVVPVDVVRGVPKAHDAAKHLRTDARLFDAQPPELAGAQTSLPGELFGGSIPA